MFSIPLHARSRRLALVMLGVALVFGGSAGRAHAALTQVNSRGALGGNDFIDWGTLGPSFTSVTNPVTLSSHNGLSVTVSQSASASFQRRDEGSGWDGVFAHGDHLLWTNGPNGPITMDFASPIWGAGLQIQADYFGSYSGIATAYDSANNPLGSFSFSGNNTGSEDNSAPFIGFLSDSADVSKIVYDVQHASNEPTNFAINQTDLVTSAPPVPEPGSLALLLTSGGSMLLALRRRKLAA